MIYSSQIGPIEIEIKGENQVARLLAEELEAEISQGKQSKSPDLRIHICGADKVDFYEPKATLSEAKLSFSENAYQVSSNSFFDYIVKDLFSSGKPCELFIFPKKNPLANLKRRFFHGFFLRDDSLYKSEVTTYTFLWHIFQALLLQRGYTFLHAAAFSTRQGAVAITGQGGAGKTSSLFKALELDGTKYLSEDFGMVDAEGEVFYHPKFVSIYQSDVRGGKRILEKFIHELRGFEKFRWVVASKFLGMNPRVKASPRTLLGADQIETSKKLNAIAFVTRSEGSETKVSDMSPEEFVESCMKVHAREMKTLFHVLELRQNHLKEVNSFWSVEDLSQKARQAYQNLAQKVQLKHLRVPKGAGPESILSSLKELSWI